MEIFRDIDGTFKQEYINIYSGQTFEKNIKTWKNFEVVTEEKEKNIKRRYKGKQELQEVLKFPIEIFLYLKP